MVNRCSIVRPTMTILWTFFEIENGSNLETGGLNFGSNATFIEIEDTETFRKELSANGIAEMSDVEYEVFRIESGIPRYGVDMDETTIVSELGLEGLISYNKGCYIGQEIIARIYFRGHVAKQLMGLRLSGEAEPNAEISTKDGKNAGRITSVTYSRKLNSFIALGYVRYDHLAVGTELQVGTVVATVTSLPFV